MTSSPPGTEIMSAAGPLTYLTTVILLLATVYLYHNAFSRRTASALQNLRGPPSDSWLFGNFKTVRDANDLETLDAWTEEYGDAFVVHNFAGMKDLYLLDLKAWSFIANRVDDFPRPWAFTVGIELFTGPGLLSAEGAEHKKQVQIFASAVFDVMD